MTENSCVNISIKCILKNVNLVALAFILAVTSQNYFATSAQAQAGALIGVFGGQAVLKDVISDLRNTISSTINNSEIAADRQIQHAANEALIVLRETEIAFSDQLDKSLERIDANVLTAVEAAYTLQQAIERGEDDLIFAIDGALLDIERIVGTSIFSKYPFLLKRVVGISQLKNNEGEYTFELRGSSFGGSLVNLTRFAIDEQEFLEDARLNAISQNVIQVNLDVEKLNPLFDTSDNVSDRKIKILPVNLTFERTTPQPWYCFFCDDKVEQLDHQFYAYFVPNYAGKLQVTNHGEEFQWQRVEDFSYNHRSRDNHCSGDCDDHKNFPCGTNRCASDEQQCVAQRQTTPLRANDERLSAPRHSGQPQHHDGVKAEIRDGGSCLYFYIRSGTHSHTITATATRERYLKQPGLVTSNMAPLPVAFGATYLIEVPKTTQISNFEIDVIGSQQPVSGELKEGINNDVLRVLSKKEVGDSIVFNVTFHYPR